MEDKFEKFISEHREQFDNLEPDPTVWKRLEKDVAKKRVFNWQDFIKKAAVVAVIFAASYFANEMVHRFKAGNNLKSSKENTIPQLSDAEAYYAGLLDQKMNELKPVIDNCPSVKEELNYDLSELDRVYVELKRDLKDNMANQDVIEAIIENYRLKISILEDLLNELSPLDEGCIPNNGKYEL